MATIEHKGKSYEVDEDGFLLKGAEEWDENWVDYVKSVEGIVLIDGTRLVHLMMDTEVGVTSRILKVPTLDTDYFE